MVEVGQYHNQIEPMLKHHSFGVVHSVFSTAINLRVDRNIMTLLASGRSLAPSSAVLKHVTAFDCFTLRVGIAASIDEKILTLAHPHGEIRFSFAHAQSQELSAQNLTLALPSANTNEMLSVLLHAIAVSKEVEHGLAPMLKSLFPTQTAGLHLDENHWSRFFAPRAAKLFTALRQRDAAMCAALAPTLAGCGPGLTPSSDDLLVGVCAVVYGSAVAGLASPTSASKLCNALTQGAILKTNDISGHFLSQAAQGFFSTDMLALLTALYGGTPKQLFTAARRVAENGASSGCDTLVGMWLAYRAGA